MPEQQNIEYKQSWRDEYLKWVCGFANAQGGRIYIGIDDKGNITGVDDYKKLMDDLPNKIVQQLGLVVDIDLHEKESRHYIEVTVPQSTVPISYHGIYHYRSGSTKQELKGTALHNWLLKKSGKSWEDIPVPGATADDLDIDTITGILPVYFSRPDMSKPGDVAPMISSGLVKRRGYPNLLSMKIREGLALYS